MIKRQKPRLSDYLTHIVQAVDRIDNYTQGLSKGDFLKDEKTQDAVIRNFEIIGEASKNIERNFRQFAAVHADVPWSIAYEMRSALAHGYFEIDLEIVWNTINVDLPALRKKVQTLVSELDAR